jgi:hypothetical protein
LHLRPRARNSLPRPRPTASPSTIDVASGMNIAIPYEQEARLAECHLITLYRPVGRAPCVIVCGSLMKRDDNVGRHRSQPIPPSDGRAIRFKMEESAPRNSNELEIFFDVAAASERAGCAYCIVRRCSIDPGDSVSDFFDSESCGFFGPRLTMRSTLTCCPALAGKNAGDIAFTSDCRHAA